MEKSRLNFASFLSVVAAGLLVISQPANSQTSKTDNPNVLFIVVDDLGYSDIGRFGGEIDTPTLDALADEGIQLTNFHTAPTCSPTRAMLLSGNDSHRAGLGNMAEVLQPNQKGKPGYEGYLNRLVATLPEVLQNNDYHTYMAGKWHLGRSEDQSPAARGFDKSFALLQGGASHFDDQKGVIANDPKALYREDGKLVSVPEGFFSSQFYTDQIIHYIDSNAESGKPFFAYAAYTAPHWPLQAPDEYLDKYKGLYKDGYEIIRESRLKRMKAMGIIANEIDAHVKIDGLPDWDDLSESERIKEQRKMEVYAAMVTNLDYHIGRLLDYLSRTNQLENTLIVFMSDNGADGNSPAPLPGNKTWIESEFNNELANYGRRNSYIWYGPQWGQVSATPFSLFKGFTAQGGIVAPAIVKLPGKQVPKGIQSQFVSVMDIMPTVLDALNIEQPQTRFNGRTVFPIQGLSVLPQLQHQQKLSAPRQIGWELFGRRAMRKGDWKIRYLEPPFGTGRWELFNLAVDPVEQRDLADVKPEKLAELLAAWQVYVEENGVYVSDLEKMKKIGYSFKTCLYETCVN